MEFVTTSISICGEMFLKAGPGFANKGGKDCELVTKQSKLIKNRLYKCFMRRKMHSLGSSVAQSGFLPPSMTCMLGLILLLLDQGAGKRTGLGPRGGGVALQLLTAPHVGV